MKILFLCTAHNSLSQRLALVLGQCHDVTIEYALSKEVMITAAALAGPDLIICPFLTTLVPREVYEQYLTLIVHPGPPGDAGPSALDWVLMGDDGEEADANILLAKLDRRSLGPGRSHWGVTVLQAIAEFDAGPVWAFEQFQINIDAPKMSKGFLYRGAVTRAAVDATLAAIQRIGLAVLIQDPGTNTMASPFSPSLAAAPAYRQFCASQALPFQGGKTHHRPLLKPSARDFDLTRHNSRQISRRLRSADSQPGVLSRVFGTPLFLYGGLIDESDDRCDVRIISSLGVPIWGFRDQAICLATCDGKGVWITHVRQPKSKNEDALKPKVPAVSGLISLGILNRETISSLTWYPNNPWQFSSSIFQEVWIDIRDDIDSRKIAYLHFDFYNGAMSTEQCSAMVDAMEHILELSRKVPINAVVLMGGSYFSNGIALNVIEAADDPATESWLNINRIDDVVQYLLERFPAQNIATVAVLRGNAAAGGVALAAACDVVLAGEHVVLNPAYRAVGLHGSEYHTISYPGRCGVANAATLLRSMTPISAIQANAIGLVDHVVPGSGSDLDDRVYSLLSTLLQMSRSSMGLRKASWKLDPATLVRVRADELREMGLDFWSARAVRYHSRRHAFVCKIKPTRTPLRFALHRQIADCSGTVGCGISADEESLDSFDDVETFRKRAEQDLLDDLRSTILEDLASKIDLSGALPPPATNMNIAGHLPKTEVVRMKGLSGSGRGVAETMFNCSYCPPTPPRLLSPPESPP